MPGIDNCLSEEIRRLNVCLLSDKLEQLENQNFEIDKRWVEIFNNFKNEHIPCENLAILVEFTLYCPGTNVAAAIVFLIGNDYWTCDKSRLDVDTLAAALTVKFNMKDFS
ncbi:dimer_Tnp_hAT domain-containing protein [Trichonephila clavipes]|nr:dimer_Tnp_hAT domain-containing protein [Trichonephila clavipes]